MAARGRPDAPGRGLPRPVEIVLAFGGLIATAPIVVFAMFAVVATSRGPALFRQTRVGRHGEPFSLLKIRSMAPDRETPDRMTSDAQVTAAGDPRITVVGRWLRRFKLDELPQLWNVVRGDMSLVGPRPEVPRYVDLDDPIWRRVLAVRPGLTDPVTLALRDEEAILAAVPGSAEDYYREVLLPEKLRGYAEYASKRSTRRDLGVLVQTVLAIIGLRRADVRAD